MSSINWLTLCPHLNICPSWLLTLRIHILPHSGHSLPCLQASRHLSNCSSPSLPPWATSWNQSRHTSVNSCIFWSMKSGDRVAYVTPSRLGFVGPHLLWSSYTKEYLTPKVPWRFERSWWVFWTRVTLNADIPLTAQINMQTVETVKQNTTGKAMKVVTWLNYV